ncbi:hypothetical protein Ddc_14577 [Ditylenchus destructor]|nr:hypothetical protein Ddc_14577 [Ditylenchus destructor]
MTSFIAHAPQERTHTSRQRLSKKKRAADAKSALEEREKVRDTVIRVRGKTALCRAKACARVNHQRPHSVRPVPPWIQRVEVLLHTHPSREHTTQQRLS